MIKRNDQPLIVEGMKLFLKMALLVIAISYSSCQKDDVQRAQKKAHPGMLMNTGDDDGKPKIPPHNP